MVIKLELDTGRSRVVECPTSRASFFFIPRWSHQIHVRAHHQSYWWKRAAVFFFRSKAAAVAVERVSERFFVSALMQPHLLISVTARGILATVCFLKLISSKQTGPCLAR